MSGNLGPIARPSMPCFRLSLQAFTASSIVESRKAGPGITKSDLLVINKTDLAPYVGASLEVMDRDARRIRGDRPFVFTNLKNLKTKVGIEPIADFVVRQGLLHT